MVLLIIIGKHDQGKNKLTLDMPNGQGGQGASLRKAATEMIISCPGNFRHRHRHRHIFVSDILFPVEHCEGWVAFNLHLIVLATLCSMSCQSCKSCLKCIQWKRGKLLADLSWLKSSANILQICWGEDLSWHSETQRAPPIKVHIHNSFYKAGG